MAITNVSNAVLVDLLSQGAAQKLINNVVFSAVATVNTELVGAPGTAIALPVYSYIGAAADATDGTALTPVVLNSTSTNATVKKAGKAVQMTRSYTEAQFADAIGEAESQLAQSIADKIEVDALASLVNVSSGAYVNQYTTDLNKGTLLTAMVTRWGEDFVAGDTVCFMSPVQASKLMSDADFIVAQPSTLLRGVLGSIWGMQIVPSNRIVNAANVTTMYALRPGGLGILLKRDLAISTQYNVLGDYDDIAAFQVYATYVRDESKVGKFSFKT
jgi:N4-gp56 family major capsid protein